MFPARITDELNKIDKRRTFGLIGFLFILAFFPVLFSSSSDKQTNSTKTEVLAAQDSEIKANQAAPTQQVGAPTGGAPAPSQQTNVPQNAVPTEPIVIPVQEEAYSPQPSVWLFIIPIVITFFTILFY